MSRRTTSSSTPRTPHNASAVGTPQTPTGSPGGRHGTGHLSVLLASALTPPPASATQLTTNVARFLNTLQEYRGGPPPQNPDLYFDYDNRRGTVGIIGARGEIESGFPLPNRAIVQPTAGSLALIGHAEQRVGSQSSELVQWLANQPQRFDNVISINQPFDVRSKASSEGASRGSPRRTTEAQHASGSRPSSSSSLNSANGALVRMGRSRSFDALRGIAFSERASFDHTDPRQIALTALPRESDTSGLRYAANVSISSGSSGRGGRFDSLPASRASSPSTSDTRLHPQPAQSPAAPRVPARQGSAQAASRRQPSRRQPFPPPAAPDTVQPRQRSRRSGRSASDECAQSPSPVH